DVMAALEEVMRQGLTNVVAGTFWDPITVAQMIDAGIGAEVTLQLGGRTDMPALNLKGKPLEVSGRVSAITDGVFTITGPMNTGSRADLGRTAVLDTGDIEIFVSEKRFEPIDAGMFAHAGIDPTQKDFVLVKSRQHFRAGFEDWAAHIVMVAGPGVCSSDYSLFPFKNLARPIYPLDEM
ncbi:MAG: ABC transporter substrate-binding protein, partial [Rhodospirillaceae bacterium]|nr:ABC transporter substrate-binding protein [Rhodospirillaceae bacterium]